MGVKRQGKILPKETEEWIVQHIVEGEYVASLFVLHTPNGKTCVFDKFRVIDKLVEINPYYDPSVLNEAVASLWRARLDFHLEYNNAARVSLCEILR